MKLKTKLFVLFFLSAASSNAQNWGGGVDDNELHFGFTFQYLSSELKILKNENWRSDPYIDQDNPEIIPSKLNAISAKQSPGFGIGFVVNKRLSDNSDIRLTPTLIFNDRILVYDYDIPSENIEKKIQSTLVEFPLGIKIKSDRRNNFRAYLLGGVKYSTDISSKKKSNNSLITDPVEKFVNNKRNYLSGEAGIGFDLYFEYFKMSPEIKLSYSLQDVLNHEPTRYATPIDKLMLRHVTFSLFFE